MIKILRSNKGAHSGEILLMKDFVCLLLKLWDTYLTPGLISCLKATVDLSVLMKINPSIIDHSKFEPAKLLTNEKGTSVEGS